MKNIQKVVLAALMGVLVALAGCEKSAEEGKRLIRENTGNPFSPSAPNNQPGYKQDSKTESKPTSALRPEIKAIRENKVNPFSPSAPNNQPGYKQDSEPAPNTESEKRDK